MPYGIPASKGGDSPENVAKMDRCVASVQEKQPGLSDSSAIAICKASLGFTKGRTMMEDRRWVFRSELLNVEAAEAQLKAGATVGEAKIRFARFGIPDTFPAVGNQRRQVIDAGAFRHFIETRDFVHDPLPFYLDHGDPERGFIDSRLKIGRAIEVTEDEQGPVAHASYNLQKQVAREAFSDLIHDPFGTQFSFRNMQADEVMREGDDGFDHIVEFRNVVEFSQTAFAAQREAGVLVDTIAARSAIPSHSTETYDSEWDASAQVGKIGGDAGATQLRKMHAWVNPDGDATAKSSYKFPHHTVEGGSVGGANVTAARAVIASLNGARGGSSIPSGDRAGVYRHAAKHLSDAGVEDIPPLKARMSAAELDEWLGEDEDMRSALREKFADEHVTPLMNLDTLPAALRSDKVLREAVEKALAEANQPDPVTDFYARTWAERAKLIAHAS